MTLSCFRGISKIIYTASFYFLEFFTFAAMKKKQNFYVQHMDSWYIPFWRAHRRCSLIFFLFRGKCFALSFMWNNNKIWRKKNYIRNVCCLIGGFRLMNVHLFVRTQLTPKPIRSCHMCVGGFGKAANERMLLWNAAFPFWKCINSMVVVEIIISSVVLGLNKCYVTSRRS